MENPYIQSPVEKVSNISRNPATNPMSKMTWVVVGTPNFRKNVKQKTVYRHKEEEQGLRGGGGDGAVETPERV